MKKGRDKEFKCIYCGKFISYKDIDDKKIGHKYTPETEITIERNEFWHLKCAKPKLDMKQIKTKSGSIEIIEVPMVKNI